MQSYIYLEKIQSKPLGFWILHKNAKYTGFVCAINHLHYLCSMKQTIGLTGFLFLILLSGCGRPTHKEAAKNPFIQDILIKTTPVRNQGANQLCWDYAMLATIESEHLMIGDSVNLSVDYIARMLLAEQSREAFFASGKKHISMRGMASMTLRLMKQYGLLHYNSYHNTEANYNILSRKIEYAAKTATNLEHLSKNVNDMLDQEIDYLPKLVYFLHAEYTPIEFANSVCYPGEYLSLTSFSHHPYNQSFALEVPDNRQNDLFLNLPLDSLMWHIKHAIRQGHPVCWEGDISEPGFSFEKGVATLPNQLTAITPQLRQQQFNVKQTTDDHCMELIGLAHTKDGKRYYIAKNSWGTHNPYGGLMYLSEAYVRLKTIAAYMSQAAYQK